MKKFCIILLTLLEAISGTICLANGPELDSLLNVAKTYQKQDTIRVKLLNIIAETYISEDNYDLSYFYANKAHVLSSSLNYKLGSATALRLKGISFTCRGEYSKSLFYLFDALKIGEAINNRYIIGKIYNSLGSNLSLQNDFNNALGYYEKSLQFYFNPIVYEDIARVHHLQGHYNFAIGFYQKALDADIPEIEKAYILNDLGDIYEQESKLDSALSYYFKALEISNKLNHKGSMCDFYGSIGDLLIKMHRYTEAIFYESKSSEISKQLDLKNVRYRSELSLSEIYERTQNFKLSLFHHKIYHSVHDSLFNEENTKQSVRSEMNFQFDKQLAIKRVEQDKKDAITLQEKKKQRIIIYSVSIVLFLMFLLAIFIFRGYKQKQKANIIITKQKQLVDAKNIEIMDGIRYASRIQQAILPPQNIINNILPEHLIYFVAKDSVSGDFYFVNSIGDKIFWASCDATGHSANGGMLSMLSLNILNEIIKEGEIIPSKILDKLNERFNEALHKVDDNSIRDGLDLTLCSFDKKTSTLSFAGANNPLWLIRANEIIEYKVDKMPIGQMYKTASYTNNEIQLQKDDCIYSFSDGICDLHSEGNKKFMKKRLRELLLSIQDKSMPEQKVIITETLSNWKGNADQVDDMLMIGVRF